ncbi:hypothetical protein VIGAN_10167700 [Vigna angularis var. angularis]|uniref:Uncharacterized protein n=1 Tax=Vigna angularis var. angularis TaxID=157739 RepID=A0A0S3T4I7_PHAAN|nr:hypothetical protein VIGAN_10167700 [Vigna angularis var. angularis]
MSNRCRFLQNSHSNKSQNDKHLSKPFLPCVQHCAVLRFANCTIPFNNFIQHTNFNAQSFTPTTQQKHTLSLLVYFSITVLYCTYTPIPNFSDLQARPRHKLKKKQV